MNAARLKWVISGIDFERLTDWEEKVLEDCEKMMERKGEISERMEEIVEGIYERKGR